MDEKNESIIRVLGRRSGMPHRTLSKILKFYSYPGLRSAGYKPCSEQHLKKDEIHVVISGFY